jgi:hypothetical protein
MNRRQAAPAAIAIAVLAMPMLSSSAVGWDRQKPMLCAMGEVFECGRGMPCQRTGLIEIGAPRFFRIDLVQKVAQGIGGAARERRSPIRTIDEVGEILVLQGMDGAIDGQRGAIGWTASMSMDGGELVLTAAAAEAAFIIFGDCLVEE